MNTNRDATLRPFEPVTGGPAWREAKAFGYDMSLIVCTARESVWQRICQHRSALNLATMLRNAHLESHAGSRKAA